MAYALAAFLRDLDEVVARHGVDCAAITNNGKPLLERLLSDPVWPSIGSACLPPQGQSYSLLCRSPSAAFTVWSMVFQPGQSTPVHDHNTWGLVGVWRGEEQEERFIRTGEQSSGAPVALELHRTTVNTPGSVTLLVPPDEDIHRIGNASQAPAYSIHVYGRLDERMSQAYDLGTGAVTRWEDDPIGTLQAWGARIDLRTLVARADATDQELLKLLKERVARARTILPPRGGKSDAAEPAG